LHFEVVVPSVVMVQVAVHAGVPAGLVALTLPLPVTVTLTE
jgi:hypothetical protein